jgi:hypothetical protein
LTAWRLHDYNEAAGGYNLPKLLLPSLAIWAVALGFVLHSSGHAQQPAATTVPVNSTRITVEYTYDGVPVIVPGVGPLSAAYVDGDYCSATVQQVAYEAIWNQTAWPWSEYPGQPAECSQAPVSVRICHGPDLGCSHEFVFEGDDVIVESSFLENVFPDASLAIAHFVHAGVPQTVSVTGWQFTAGGHVCGAGPTSAVYVPPAVVSVVGRLWSAGPGCDTPEIEVHFNTLEFGELEGSFLWEGGTVHYDVDTGAFAPTPSPSPTPSLSPTPALVQTVEPTISPVQLPRSGDGTTGVGSLNNYLLIGLVAISIGIFCLLLSDA